MHKNSKLAFMESADKLSERAYTVYNFIRCEGPMTDRQVMEGLGFSEPNSVRPRITELIRGGFLREQEAGVKCPVTHKTVRRVEAVERQQLLAV